MLQGNTLKKKVEQLFSTTYKMPHRCMRCTKKYALRLNMYAVLIQFLVPFAKELPLTQESITKPSLSSKTGLKKPPYGPQFPKLPKMYRCTKYYSRQN